MPDFLRYRQIHLDFHTSEQLTNIGGEFDGTHGRNNWSTPTSTPSPASPAGITA